MYYVIARESSAVLKVNIDVSCLKLVLSGRRRPEMAGDMSQLTHSNLKYAHVIQVCLWTLRKVCRSSTALHDRLAVLEHPDSDPVGECLPQR